MFPKRRLLAVGIAALISALLFLPIPRRECSATILDAKFRLLSVNQSHGQVHKLYPNGPVAGRIQELIHRAGSKYGDAPLLGFTTNVTDALVVRFRGDFPPNALKGVQAEVVDDSGATNRLWCVVGQRRDHAKSVRKDLGVGSATHQRDDHPVDSSIGQTAPGRDSLASSLSGRGLRFLRETVGSPALRTVTTTNRCAQLPLTGPAKFFRLRKP